MKKMLFASPLVIGLLLTTGILQAAEEVPAQQQNMETQQQMYGYQLMTNEERMEFRNKMRAAKTVEERAQIQAEHHERMKIRAEERGVTLPDQPIMKGGANRKGTGSNAGQRQGAGQGRR